ncbi:MAG: hypothetical protein Q8M70_03585 [bacterium]|nr:hypothetical protein [bacterium]
MRDFFQRVFNTEFLPMSEVRKIKVIIVLVFLFIVTIATVPFSLVFDYSLGVKIGSIALLFLLYISMIFMVRFGKHKAAIQLSIVYMFLVTLFYTQGTSSFYAYLFFYILLTIVVFYQELYLYLFYGTLTVVLGVSYVLFNVESFQELGNSPYIVLSLVAILVLFFLVFLVQILHSEVLYTGLNLEWVKMNHIVEKHQEQSLFFIEELRKKNKEMPLYENLDFQKVADELAIFIAEQFRENGKEITNVLDLYLYIHERGLAHILENDDFSVAMKKIANRLDKYLLNHRSDMMSMILNFSTKFLPTEAYKPTRYDYHLSQLCPTLEDQVIALAMIYQYLANEVSGLDTYDQMTKVLTPNEIASLLTSSEVEDFLSPELIAFFKDNQTLFEETLLSLKRKDS